MYEEAGGILYIDYTAEVDIYWGSVFNRRVIESAHRKVSVTVGHKLLARANLYNGRVLLEAGECWREARLAKFKSIDVNVHVYDDTADREDITRELVCSANQTMYSLCSALAGSKTLKQLTVQVRGLQERYR